MYLGFFALTWLGAVIVLVITGPWWGAILVALLGLPFAVTVWNMIADERRV